MKTYIHLKTGTRFPNSGWYSAFDVKPTGRSKYFVKFGHKLCSKGWQTFKKKEWREETIPDLEKPFTREQWVTYAKLYGDECAMGFLECCEMMKPSGAYRMHHPPKNEEQWNDPNLRAWFRKTFKAGLWDFLDGYMYGLANECSLDILKFERHLECEFKYPSRGDGSMREFMEKTFSEKDNLLFIMNFFPNLLKESDDEGSIPTPVPVAEGCQPAA